MDKLTREDLRALLERQDGLCVSVYMPTYRAGPEVRQNAIRFKNLIGRVDEALRAQGMREVEMERLLGPARALIHDQPFWETQSDGLAVFIAPGEFRRYQLPVRFTESATVSHRYHVKPLLATFREDGLFYVLAISQKVTRFYRCGHHSIDEVNVPALPKGLEEALNLDRSERYLQYHSGTGSSAGGRRAAIFHGQGAWIDDHRENLIEYFRAVDRALHPILKDARAPLVLACVEYLLPIYREVNTYAHLVEQAVAGNPDESSAKLLHERSWEIVRPVFRRSLERACQRFLEQSGSKLASDDLKVVVPGAYKGRVDTLLVSETAQVWGRFDESNLQTHVHEQCERNDIDLLDFAACHTLLHGGQVHVVPSAEMPEGRVVAACLRY